MENIVFQQDAVCCCCWQMFGAISKSLSIVNSTVEDMMKLFVYPRYILGMCSYSNIVCSGCQRNLF